MRVKQGAILASAARLLKPGGRLVYATCSLLEIENEDVVREFDESHADRFERQPASAVLTRAQVGAAGALVEQDCLRLWPHRHGTDGFFAAVWQRKRLGADRSN